MNNAQGKPRRWRRIAKWACVLLAVAIIVVAIEAIRAASLKPSITTDYAKQINDLTFAQVPPGQSPREWRELAGVVSSLKPRFPTGNETSPDIVVDALTAEDIAALRQLPSLAYAIKRLQPDRSIAAQVAPLVDEGLNTSPLRGAARLIRCRLEVALARQQPDIAAESLDQLDALATASCVQPAYLSYLSGAAIEALTTGAIRQALIEGRISPEMAQPLLTALTNARPKPAAPLYQVNIALSHAFDQAQRTFTDEGDNRGTLILTAYNAHIADANPLTPEGEAFIISLRGKMPNYTHWRYNMFQWRLPSRLESLGKFGEAINEIIADSQKTASQRRSPDAWKAWRATRISLAENIFTQTIALESAASISDAEASKRGGTLLQLALMAHKHRVGTYPASLEQLVPTELSALPTDPLALDGRYIYRVDGDNYMLYSVAADGVDNQGTMRPTEAFRVFNNTTFAAGYDFVFSSDVEF